MTAAIPAGAGPVQPGAAPGRAGADPSTDTTSVAFLAALSAALPVPSPQDAAVPAAAAGPVGVQPAGAVASAAAGSAAVALSAGPSLGSPAVTEAAGPAPTAAAPGAPSPAGRTAGSAAAVLSTGLSTGPSTAQAAGVQWLAPVAPATGPDASAAGAGSAAGTGTIDVTDQPRAVVTGQAPAFVPAPPAAAFALPAPGDRLPTVEAPAVQADPALPAAGVSGTAAAAGGGGEARDTGSSGSGDRPRTVLAPPVTPSFHPAVPVHVSTVEPVAPTAQAPAAPRELPHHQVMTAVSPLLRGPDGEQSLRLQLHPQDLGAVNVTVELRRGEVAIHLHAADGAAADLLRDHLPDLRAQLEDQGLRAGALQVDTGSAGS
ncbi:flagellar hook-length control protein FliK, partial [Oryzihumus sp.]|uniref:flagellar hook-length control protein FliK n=1 Tax=Oryzihumus sp. TaxID=1968903 RepID=UPI002ED9A6E6